MGNSRELFLRYLGQTSPSPVMIEIEKAEGIFLYTPEGKRYIDLVSGVSVSNIGHRHPAVIRAIGQQLDKYLHVMVYGEMVQSPQVQLAECLAQQLEEGLDVVYLVNSGSEANEGALKLAKRVTGRSRIVAAHKAYHGGTSGALSITGDEGLKSAFRPLLPEVRFMRFNEKDDLSLIDAQTAAVVLEPVQAEAGVILPEEGYLQAVRERCDETGALLIFDEIQTGMGRLGALFAHQLYGVKPDILTLAKALGGGMPLGAFISSTENMKKLTYDPMLGHITTFGGHPVSAAAALASLQVILRENLPAKARETAALFREKLQHETITEIRGEGLLLAVRLRHPALAQYVVDKAPDYGLIIDRFLFCDDAFRIAPPLTTTAEEVELICEILLKLLDHAHETHSA